MTNMKKQHLQRGAGVLLPISSLPSPYGIGTLGKESYEFVDFLSRIGCRYWQVLPIGPTSFGDSPYQSFSAFAGNPYFIDLDCLVEEHLLEKDEVSTYSWQVTDQKVDYATIYNFRFQVLRLAYQRSKHQASKAYINFCLKSSYWLEDYSLYMSLKAHFHYQEWLLWEEDIRYRTPRALEYYRTLLKDDIEFWKFVQFKFHEQWDLLKQYTSSKGINIIGDIPLYVAMDSSDVWSHNELFELDERKNPINVAGVPPDLFSEYGQRWGNPLYCWDVMEKNDFTWWKERMKASSSLYDVIRIDHFIGVVNYYSIPVECPTAVEGCWKEGPGKKLTDVIQSSIGEAKIIAEDLGVMTPNVIALIKETGFPGMKILEFGLDGPPDNEYLPHNYGSSNIVAYTGTHDNETLVGYLGKKSSDDIYFLCKYFQVTKEDDLPEAIIKTLYACVADVIVIQMQDLLKLDNQARMNYPSTIGGNWNWRMTKDQYPMLNEEILYELAYLYGRI